MVISTSWWRASCSISAVSSGLANRASATVVGSPRAASSSAAFIARPGGCPATGSRRCCPRAPRGPGRSPAPRPRSAAPRRCPRRADSATREGRSSIAAAVATTCTSSRLVGRRHDHHARQAAEIGDVEAAGMGGAVGADQPGAVHARSAPAGAGSPRRAPPGRRRAAGRSNRSRRTASSPRSPGRRRRSPHAARRCRHRSSGRGSAAANLSSPVPDGIAAVIATIPCRARPPRSARWRRHLV